MARPVSVFDSYTSLMHLAGLDPDTPPTVHPPPWMPKATQRRMHAYRILSTYMTNSARFNRTRLPSDKARREIREYGDPRLIVNRTVSGVLGSGPVFTVEGAAAPPPHVPDIPERPGPVDSGDAEADASINARVEAVWRTRRDAAVDDWETAWQSYPQRVARQAWLDEWLDVEQVQAKLYEAEQTGAIPLGDAVLVVGYDAHRRRPTLTVFEPNAYHPVLVESSPGEFPDVVHIVWEFNVDPEAGADTAATHLHKVTYRLVELDTPRRLPWHDADTPPATHTCTVTDLTFDLRRSGVTLAGLADADGVPALDADGAPIVDYDLGVDFLPVVHWPNTPAGSEHFGMSALAPVAQLLDDLASLDTDISKAAALAAVPPVFVSGANTAAGLTLAPGSIVGMSADGRAVAVDLSAGLVALLGALEALFDRLSVVTQVPGVVLGRVTGEAASGVALALSFAPFDQLAAVLRLTRFSAYGLVVKFAQRLAQVHGHLEPGPNPPVAVHFQSTTPHDLDATVRQVVALLAAHGIDRSLAVEVLREAGFHDHDVAAVVARIANEDTEGAERISNAVGIEHPEAAARYLGIDVEQTDDGADGLPPDLNFAPPA